MTYSNATKSRAKAMAIAYGNAARARVVLRETDADGAPSERTIQMWVKDSRVIADERFLRDFAASAEFTVMASVRRIVEPLEAQLRAAIVDGSAREVLDLTRSWGLVIDRIRPASGPAERGAKARNRKSPTVVAFSPFRLDED